MTNFLSKITATNELQNTNLPLFTIKPSGTTAAQQATGSFKVLTDGNGNEVQSVSFAGTGTAFLSLGSVPGSTPLSVAPSVNEQQRLSFTGPGVTLTAGRYTPRLAGRFLNRPASLNLAGDVAGPDHAGLHHLGVNAPQVEPPADRRVDELLRVDPAAHLFGVRWNLLLAGGGTLAGLAWYAASQREPSPPVAGAPRA